MPNNPNINRNPDGTYMDASQITKDIIENRLQDDMKELLKNGFVSTVGEGEEFGFDMGIFARSELGRWIRNSYGLWNDDNPHTMVEWVKYGSTPDSMFHPDNFSHTIIERLEDHFA